MTEEEALNLMVAPGTRRPGKWMEGVMQIHLTRACDLSCSNCTQGSQFGGKPDFMTLDNFEKACRSLKGYFGLVGIFGGNPALHPQFPQICDILRSYFPQEQCGLWCNNPRGHGAVMRKTFNPSMSNLNVHLRSEAFEEFKRDWPESRPFGLDKDSRHSPVHGNLAKFVPEESERWKLISNCPINQHWSAMLCQIRGELRAFFCEIAGSQAILNQHNPDYPDIGMPICEYCNGTGTITAYRGEPSQGTELVRCDGCFGKQWWRKPMQDFAEQVRFHCHRCLVPLNGHGALAQQEHVTTITEEYSHLKPKGSHLLEILDSGDDIHCESTRKVIQYLGH